MYCMYVCVYVGEVEGDASKVMGEVMQVDDGDDEDEETDTQRRRDDHQLLTEQMVCMYVCMYCMYVC